MKCKEKVKFDTRDDSKKRLQEILSCDDKRKKPLRVYFCDLCKGFHLTSWSKSKKKFVQVKFENINQKRIHSVVEFFAKRKKWDINQLF